MNGTCLREAGEVHEKQYELERVSGKGNQRLDLEIKLCETDHVLKDEEMIDQLPGDLNRVFYAVELEEKLRDAEAAKEKLQLQLSQLQKMESIGRLVGGVAHDFNNMLTVIQGNAEMAVEETGPSGALYPELQEILKAAKRSSSLTRQLLDFARQEVVAPKTSDLNEAVEIMLTLLRRLMGGQIRVDWQPGLEAGQVLMEPSQIDQILVNLCVNARDAMQGEGSIIIETDRIVFDEKACAGQANAIPGDYVRLAVSDDGCGMTDDTQAHLFEPFFTTKGLGEGTGLGLATVYDIVRQNRGFISVHSEVGLGTTFKIYLPRYAVQIGATRDVDGKVSCNMGPGLA